jgi:hypothetical protein
MHPSPLGLGINVDQHAKGANRTLPKPMERVAGHRAMGYNGKYLADRLHPDRRQ